MNLNEKPQHDEATSWTLAGLWLLFIYVTIPLARTIQEYIRDHGGKMVFLWATFVAFALAAGWVIRAVWRKQLDLSPARVAWLSVTLGLFVWMAWSLRANPEESLHFVQYGVLSLLIHRALSHRMPDRSIYMAGIMLGSMFGIIDELIQWVVPKRFFDFRDIGINVMAVVLVQLAVAIGIRPAIIEKRWGSTGFKIGFAAMLLNLLMLLFCVSNTPEFRGFYGRYFPGVAEFKDMTIEYGYFYDDPETGGFKSRLPPEELARQDRERYQEVVPALDRYPKDNQYLYFMGKAKPHEKPLLVEARVHIFRRDRYAQMALRTNHDRKLKRAYAVVAHQENVILEKYFPNVLSHSIYVWPDDKKKAFAELSRGMRMSESKVSSELVTRVSKGTLTGILCGFIALSLGGLVWSFRRETS